MEIGIATKVAAVDNQFTCDSLSSSIKNYEKEYNYQMQFDDLQSTFECCGANSSKDYDSFQNYRRNRPSSCLYNILLFTKVLTRQRTLFEKTRKHLKDKWKTDVKRMLDAENSLFKAKTAYYQRCQAGVKLREELATAQNFLNELSASLSASFSGGTPSLTLSTGTVSSTLTTGITSGQSNLSGDLLFYWVLWRKLDYKFYITEKL
ncbi:hypothetical protein MN116_009091 [Schistosoma mekongi]|uniref:Uncharacterized protein n=1 Tax=Schistosoma mekongi TaxID=38744 RepID=A0AAE2D184_SCHME|nr:hypothetical protein MN116_009091 [Schistosoma mekongi]